MWWVAVPVVLYGIYKLVSDEEKRSYKEWNEKRVQVEKTLEEHEKNIRDHISQAKNSYDFHFLTNLHFSSMKVADAAYKTKKSADISLESISRMIMLSKESKIKLETELSIAKNNKNKKEVIQIINNLKDINSHRKALFDEKDKIKAQRDGFYEKLKQLNARTAELKLFIRDRCGSRGQEWYQARLANRK